MALSTAATFGLLAACSSLLQEPPGISYAKSVEQLGIYPVYPPREDIQVGDVYGVEFATKGGNVDKARLHTVFVHNINLTNQIKEYLGQRYKFADTTVTSTGTVNGISAGLPSQKDAPSGGNVLDREDMQTLPITGFPAIEVDSGLSIGVAGASQSMAAIFGFAAARTLKMTLHFGLVTSYSVPVPVALNALETYCEVRTQIPPPDGCKDSELATYINQKYLLGSHGPHSVQHAVALMVSKVYLARAISYTFNDRTLAAAAAAIAGPTKGAKAPTIDGNLLSAAVASDDPAMVSALAAFQDSLNGTVASQSNADGASLQIAGYNENSVTFQEIYQRPVVVGYEAVYLPGQK